ncbi:MAG: YfhO family protein, partial [Erysipelotrichaceae bacterium]|nr:YfhO family protein [Erysipelotrichaceae bacterium]
IYWWFQVVDYDALQMLSTKYYIVKDKNELPHEQFTPLGSLGKSEYLLFEDQQYLPMGYTYVDTITFEELYQYDYYTQLHHMKNRLVTNQQQPLSGTRSYLKDFQIQKNTIKGNIDVNGNQYLFFSIPYDEGWTCYVNGKVMPIQKAHQGFMAIYLQEGHHEITLTFIPNGLKKGMLLSVIAIVSYVIIVVLHHKYNKRREKRV